MKQGCVLSPLLFNIFIDWIIRRAMDAVGESGIEIRFTRRRKGLNLNEAELTEARLVNLLMYADDMAVLG